MAYTPSYTKKNFVNGSAPAINATNLNAMETTLVNLENFAQDADSAIASNTSAIGDEATARQNADASLLTTLNNHSTQIANKYDKVYTNGTDGTLTDSDNGLLKNMLVKGKCEQKSLSGKNLLNPNDYEQLPLLNRTIENGYIVDNGTSDSRTWNYSNCEYKLPLKAGTYTITIDVVRLGANKYFEVIKEDGTFLVGYTDYSATSSKTFTLDSDSNVGIIIKLNGGKVGVLLEKSSSATEWEQYCGGIPAPNPSFPQSISKVTSAKVVVRGKNLLNPNGWVDGEISQTDGKTITQTGGTKHTDYLEVYADKISVVFPNYSRAFFYDENLNYISTVSSYPNFICAITVPTNAKYVRVHSNSTTENWNSETFRKSLMVANGSDTTFEPYTEQSVSTNLTLYGIGSTCDYIDVVRGKVVRKIGSVDLGSLSWTKTNENYYRFSTSISNTKNLDSSSIVANALCNKYCIVSASSQYASGVSGISKQGGNSDIWYARDTSYTSASDFKSAMNGTTLLYELATPTETDLDATVLAQLRALTSYYPSTNLVITSDEINGSSTFDYPLNLESFIHNVETDVTSLIDALA